MPLNDSCQWFLWVQGQVNIGDSPTRLIQDESERPSAFDISTPQDRYRRKEALACSPEHTRETGAGTNNGQPHRGLCLPASIAIDSDSVSLLQSLEGDSPRGIRDSQQEGCPAHPMKFQSLANGAGLAGLV